MNILFVTDHLGYAGGAWHGCTTYYANVLPQLRRMGHDVSLVVLREEHPAAALLRREGVTVTSLDAHRASLQPIFTVANWIGRNAVNVVHATQRESVAIARTLKPFMPLTPVVMHVVDSDPVPPLERIVNQWLPQPDAALCVSAAMRPTAVSQWGVDNERVRVLHNAIDLAKIKPSGFDVRSRLRAEWGVSRGASVVVSTSRFTEEKRLDVLISLMPSVLARAPETVFVFAGNGADMESCRELAVRLGVIDSVRFLGLRHDIPDVLAASDVAVMLCLREAFGYSAAEAMAMGIPVAAYAAAGLTEVVTHDRSGLLAAAGNDAAFAENLVDLLLDQSLRARLGQGAREEAERFGVKKHADTLVRLYMQLALEGELPRGKAA